MDTLSDELFGFLDKKSLNSNVKSLLMIF